ncbi:MAG: tetratricopeptide repeat protein [Anaerolineales bacterium]|nr:tetratricopeptide repeat protein [Anaerolineales bacterium]
MNNQRLSTNPGMREERAVSLDALLSQAVELAWQERCDYSTVVAGMDARALLYENALQALSDPKGSAPKRADLLLSLGLLCWRKGNFEGASRLLQVALEVVRVLQDRRREVECLNAIALTKTDMGKPAEAISAYKRALSLVPEQIFPWNNLGNLYMRLGLCEDALSAYQKAIEHNPQDGVSWNGLGDCYQRLERLEEAKFAYQRAIKALPRFATPWCGLADSYARLGKLPQALRAYSQAVSVNNRYLKAWIRLGNLYEYQQRLDEARDAYQRALELNPDQAPLWNRVGNVHFKVGRYEEAVEAYYKAIQLDRDYSWSYNNLALVRMHQGQHVEAVALYEIGIELAATSFEKANSLNKLAHTYRKLNDPDHAMLVYQIADDLDQNSALMDQDQFMPGPRLQLGGAIEEVPTSFEDGGSVCGVCPVFDEVQPTAQPEVDWQDSTRPPARSMGDPVDGHRDGRDGHAQTSLREKAEEGWRVHSTAYRGRGKRIESAQRQIAQNPQNGMAYCDLAFLYTQNGDYRQAITLYKQGLGLLTNDGDKAVIWNRLGNVYRRMNDYENAVDAYEMADGLKPAEARLAHRSRYSLLSNCYAE